MSRASCSPGWRPIWQATDYACGRRLAAMLPEWIPAYEAYERKLLTEARDKLLAVSARTLDRLLEPLRVQGLGRSLTRPGTLLRHQIPIRGSVWEENQAGWLEVDTVALCGGQRGRGICLDARRGGLRDDLGGNACALGAGPGGNAGRAARYRSLPAFFAAGIGQRQRRGVLELPRDEVAATAAATGVHDAQRPYKKDDNAHVEQKNWTHIRQCLATSGTTTPKSSNRSMCWSREPMGSCLITFTPVSSWSARNALKAYQADLRRRPNALGAGVGQPRSDTANQAAITAGKGAAKSFRPEAAGRAKLENHCGSASGAPLKIVNNSPPQTPPWAPGVRPQGGASWGSPAAPLLVLTRHPTREELPREKTLKN